MVSWKYDNDDDVIKIVIPTSASYTMEGRILWMPFTTLTEHTTRNVVAIACLKHLMTESFTISKLPTSDSVSSVASWVMALQCTVTSLDSFLVIFA